MNTTDRPVDGFDLDRETTLTSLGDGRYAVDVSDCWNIGDNPNGGYLTAIALQALRRLGDHAGGLSARDRHRLSLLLLRRRQPAVPGVRPRTP